MNVSPNGDPGMPERAARQRKDGNEMRRVLMLSALLLVGCSNPSTPAGYVGYVTQGAWFGHDRFYAMQTGPTSTGLGWLLSATNVSVTPYTYHEPMQVLSHDNLQVSFQVHVVWKVRGDHDSVKTFIEKFSTHDKNSDK